MNVHRAGGSALGPAGTCRRATGVTVAAVLGVVLWGEVAHTQDAGIVCESRAKSANNCYRLTTPRGEARGLVVLLPYFGSDANTFAATALPELLRKQNVVTMAISGSGYLTDGDLETLNGLIGKVASTHKIPAGKVIIGGVSAGGTGAVRYAEYCLSGHCGAGITPAGVFAVDAPLDFERWWNSQQLSLRRGDPKSSLEESQAVLDALRSALGGSPDEAQSRYRARSPFLASVRGGGNARLLRRMPIKLYTEPDILWAIDTAGRDYYTTNAIDQAALILELRALGNTNADLVVTTGRGFRPPGIRNPHSWTIVDEARLADWIVQLLGR